MPADVTHQRTYRYGAKAVLPFGHGLSLTKFSLAFAGDAATVEADAEAEADSGVRRLSTGGAVQHNFTIAVKNTGGLRGDEVVQAYFIPTNVPGLKQFPQKALFGTSYAATATGSHFKGLIVLRLSFVLSLSWEIIVFPELSLSWQTVIIFLEETC